MDFLCSPYWLLLVLLTNAILANTDDSNDDDDICSPLKCNVTSLTNLTKTDEFFLDLDDASDPNDKFILHERWQLYCCFISSPYCPVIHWFKNGNELFTEDSVMRIKDHNRVLEIFNPKKTDAGVYSCNATTVHGQRLSHVMTVKYERRCDDKIHVEGSPNQIEDKLRVEVGADVVLKCSFFCYGKNTLSTVYWRNGKGALIENGNEYKISDVTQGSDGSGPYAFANLTVVRFTKSDNITCHTKGQYVGSYTFHLVAEVTAGHTGRGESFFESKGQWILIACVSGTVVIMALVLLWFRERIKKWSIFYLPNHKPEILAKYDAFVSFSEADGGSFVRSTLVPMLEEDCGYTLSLHYREFVLGRPIVENILSFIDDSRRIITVVTPVFLKSEWCRFEVDQGLRRAVERPNTLVVIMLNKMPRNEMPKSLRHFINRVTFLEWDGRQPQKMREKLVRALGKPCTHEDPEKPGQEVNREQDVVIEGVAASTNAAYEQPNGTIFNTV